MAAAPALPHEPTTAPSPPVAVAVVPPVANSTGPLSVQDAPMDDVSAAGSDHPTVVTLPGNPRSTLTPPSPIPSHRSSTSALTPSSSPARPQAPRDPSQERDELVESSLRGTPVSSEPAPAIPADPPLASHARLLDPRAGFRIDTEMEWRAFEPNWRLQYVARDSRVGGHTVYPPVACSGCIEGKAVCSGVVGVKCARCKARHSVCSHYVSFPRSSSSTPLIPRLFLARHFRR